MSASAASRYRSPTLIGHADTMATMVGLGGVPAHKLWFVGLTLGSSKRTSAMSIALCPAAAGAAGDLEIVRPDSEVQAHVSGGLIDIAAGGDASFHLTSAAAPYYSIYVCM